MNATVTPASPQSVNLICLKWGTRYGSHYVNMLYRGISRNLGRPFRFFCCTGDARGLDQGVEIIPFPVNPGIRRGWPDVLVKLMVLQDGFGGLQGPTLFLDLDVAITGPIDCFFDYKPGEFCIIHNWVNWRKAILGRRPAVGNSSVFRFEAGQSNYTYETFLREVQRLGDRKVFGTEQVFLTNTLGNPQWSDEWLRSYKWNRHPTFPLNLFHMPQLPRGCQIVVFHGGPDEAIRGYQGPKLHHRSLPHRGSPTSGN